MRDMLTSLAMRPVGERYSAAVLRAAGAEPPEDVTHAALAMLHQAVTFHTIVGEGADDDDDEGGANGLLKPIDEIDGPPRVSRQNFSRELKLLDALFPMVQAPVGAGIALSELANVPAVARVQLAAFKALMQVVQDNRRSEIYFATHTCDVAWQPSSRPSSRLSLIHI